VANIEIERNINEIVINFYEASICDFGSMHADDKLKNIFLDCFYRRVTNSYTLIYFFKI
jgi:Txe/YoeB family toxin of Txe-Axe toxin-antitoxin module